MLEMCQVDELHGRAGGVQSGNAVAQALAADDIRVVDREYDESCDVRAATKNFL